MGQVIDRTRAVIMPLTQPSRLGMYLWCVCYVSSPTRAFLFASQLPESDAGDVFEG